MREDVAHYAGELSPCHWFLRRAEARRTAQRFFRIEICRPLRGRHFGHAAEEPAHWARPQEHAIVRAPRQESGTAAHLAFALRRATRKQFGFAARMRAACRVPRA